MFKSKYPRGRPHKGLVEFMAQAIELQLCSDGGHEDARELMLAPIHFVAWHFTGHLQLHREQNTRADMAGLKALAEKHEVAVLSGCPDNCVVNERKRGFTAEQLPRNILYIRILGAMPTCSTG